jgi:hypothetical protein
MKGRIFVATLVAASLMSFGALAYPTHHNNKNSGPSITLNHSPVAIAVVTQSANGSKGGDGGTNIAVVNQNSPIAVIVGGFPY